MSRVKIRRILDSLKIDLFLEDWYILRWVSVNFIYFLLLKVILQKSFTSLLHHGLILEMKNLSWQITQSLSLKIFKVLPRIRQTFDATLFMFSYPVPNVDFFDIEIIKFTPPINIPQFIRIDPNRLGVFAWPKRNYKLCVFLTHAMIEL